MGVIKQTLREESLGKLNNMGEFSLCKLIIGVLSSNKRCGGES